MQTATDTDPDLFQLVADKLPEPPETDEAIPPWTEEEVVRLHWRLLAEVRKLERPEGSLEEKIDLLRWVFAEKSLEGQPFSFASCLRVVGCSPHSPIPYTGVIDTDEIRSWLRRHLRGWFDQAFSAYPPWVREAIEHNPVWVAECLNKNPQWLNQQIGRLNGTASLFD